MAMREPVPPFEYDGTGGIVDAEKFHYPRVSELNVYHRPQDPIGRNLMVGDIIECSIPYTMSGQSEPFAWNVCHYRLNAIVGVGTIQQFADAVIEEWGQAFKAVGLNPFFGGSVTDHTKQMAVGPVRCLNLSSTGDEAFSDVYHVPGGGSDFLPLRTAACLIKHTATPGNSGVGKLFLPGLSETMQDAGRIQESFRASLEKAMADFVDLNDIGTASGTNAGMVVYSTKKSAAMKANVAYPVTSVSAASVLSSIRDRVRVS